MPPYTTGVQLSAVVEVFRWRKRPHACRGSFTLKTDAGRTVRDAIGRRIRQRLPNLSAPKPIQALTVDAGHVKLHEEAELFPGATPGDTICSRRSDTSSVVGFKEISLLMHAPGFVGVFLSRESGAQHPDRTSLPICLPIYRTLRKCISGSCAESTLWDQRVEPHENISVIVVGVRHRWHTLR